MQPYPVALAIAALVAFRGLRSGSLSSSGALAAAALGYCALANPLKVFATCLLAFYFAGSRATKVKAAVKATYEEAPEATSSAPASDKPSAASHGRTATQVACNALVGSLCALAWRVLYSGEQGDIVWGPPGERWTSRALVLAAVAFWAACCGDTLGILSRSPPRLLTTLRPCPRGTNGGISPWGTLVSLLGGLFIGTLAVVSLVLQGQRGACAGEGERTWWIEVVAVAGAAGLGGSLLDSFFGATLQPTYFSTTRNLVVHSPTPAHAGDVVTRVPGSGFDVLSNNGVNLVSAAAVAGAAGWWALQ
ncbi:hypothetical protein Rhopal_007290-T1 [Rhodotorula paludigena]|uniref:Integral membrane protein DUF92-domain-containing protein n=1 Tax=Rhodotorula paludigena TaxID=86838 RepID=A0AAV5GNQ6_9BASI|nr:hypothetical protein Rhopal_007290-T1 [Rhodotorula paludigena]